MLQINSVISFTWILMDVLLDVPSDVLERTAPSLTAFCLPITSLVQLAGEVVWISHRRGLGMPRHRKTRLLHWPAYRLLFLIRILDWNQIVSFSNREQGVVIFLLQDFLSHCYSCPDCWSPGATDLDFKSIGIFIHFASTDLATNSPFPILSLDLHFF